jgi:CubicO group peptidase (beta-lactamase class C family)
VCAPPYLWFSMTKIVTATAVMRLAGIGALDLDAPVAEYFPAFAMVAQPQPVTVRHLLSHSSGLANPVPIRWVRAADTPAPDRAAFVERMLTRHRPAAVHPGYPGPLLQPRLRLSLRPQTWTGFPTTRTQATATDTFNCSLTPDLVGADVGDHEHGMRSQHGIWKLRHLFHSSRSEGIFPFRRASTAPIPSVASRLRTIPTPQ